ncbi:hypothetical protein MUK42_33524 [Musa troglodytarum]|uniref:Uncharacterized protein n=1 Tax=Musa troglodytarum TaxID=320322 RepID=A0A9E7FC68_9LILI|nr:hypothetical protein MUK42_33524 [Musa troglodytarum]
MLGSLQNLMCGRIQLRPPKSRGDLSTLSTSPPIPNLPPSSNTPSPAVALELLLWNRKKMFVKRRFHCHD